MPLTSDEVADLTTEPAKVSVDGQSVESRPADDIIKLDRYAASKSAMANGASGWATLRPAAVRPPGAV